MAKIAQAQALLEEIDVLIDETITPADRLKETNKLLTDVVKGLADRSVKLPDKLPVEVTNQKDFPQQIAVSNLSEIKPPVVNIPKEVVVTNLKDIPKPNITIPREFKISNLGEIPTPNFPSEMKFTKPEWLADFKFNPQLNLPTTAIDPISVRLSDGERFYDLLTQVLNPSGGGGESASPRGLDMGVFDFVGVTYPSATTEVYDFRGGGASGFKVGLVTVVYTDSTKANLLSVTKV